LKKPFFDLLKSHLCNPKSHFSLPKKPPKNQDFSSKWYTLEGIGGMDGAGGERLFNGAVSQLF
jgi:hypothetical protein